MTKKASSKPRPASARRNMTALGPPIRLRCSKRERVMTVMPAIGPLLVKAGPGIDGLRLFVHDSSRGGDQTYRRIRFQDRRHAGERFARAKKIVGVQPLHVLALRHGQAGVAIFHHPAVNRGDRHHDAAVLARITPRDRDRIIRGTIVRDNQLEVRKDCARTDSIASGRKRP